MLQSTVWLFLSVLGHSREGFPWGDVPEAVWKHSWLYLQGHGGNTGLAGQRLQKPDWFGHGEQRASALRMGSFLGRSRAVLGTSPALRGAMGAVCPQEGTH